MSTEGIGGTVVPVVLLCCAIGALLIGAAVMPSLTDHSPGADAIGLDSDRSGDGGGQFAGAGASPGQDPGAGGDGAGSFPAGASGDNDVSRALLGLIEQLGLSGVFGDGISSEELDSAESIADDSSEAESESEDDGDLASDNDGDDAGSDDDDRGDAGAGADSSGPGDDSSDDAAGQLSSIGPYIIGGVALLVLVYLWRSDVGVVAALRALPSMLLSGAIGALIVLSSALERVFGALKGLESVAALPGAVSAAVFSWFRSARRRADSLSIRSLRGGSTTSPDEEPADAAPADPDSARMRIHDAWETVIDRTPVYRYRTLTPGEIERDAVGAGLPGGPVRTITDAFRDVEYGGSDPGTRVEQVERARDDLEATLQDDGRDEE